MHAPGHGPFAQRIAWSTVAKVLGMFLLILGTKFWMLRMCSSPLPVFDQWEAEGKYLLRPWLRGDLRLSDLFGPWVQHRIVWSRLLVLGLFQLNGQWDTQVEAIVAECLRAGTAVLLAAVLIRRLGRTWEDAILLCLLLLFGLPFTLENTLSGGLASQYYSLLLLAVVAIWGLASHRPGTLAWWIGAVGACLAWFSMATGGFPALAVAIWLGLRLARRDGIRREHVATLAVALALGAGGLALSIGVEQQAALQAHSASELLIRFAGLLGWPNPMAWTAPVAYAPFVCLVWRTWRRQDEGEVAAFLIPLGIFVLLNTAALAYARNHYGNLAVSRYMDFLCFGALVNFACLLVFMRDAQEAGAPPRARAELGLLTAVWVAVAGFGLIRLTAVNLADDLPFTKLSSEHAVENVAAFVARPDVQKFVAHDPFDLQCEKPPLVVALLQDPDIRRVLPAQARQPVPLESASDSPQIHRVASEAGKDGWLLEPEPHGRSVHFRSRTISGLRLPYLRFPVISGLGEAAVLALVDERSGAVSPLQPDAPVDGWQQALVKTPTGPFRVEAVLAAGATRPLGFYDPREVGRLSAWVDTVLNASTCLLFAGLALWLGAVFWRRLGLHELRPRWQRAPLGEAGFAAAVPALGIAEAPYSPDEVTAAGMDRAEINARSERREPAKAWEASPRRP